MDNNISFSDYGTNIESSTFENWIEEIHNFPAFIKELSEYQIQKALHYLDFR